MALAKNGPLHVRALARLLKIDSHKAFTMVDVLERTGVVLKRRRPGGRKYVALDRSFPAYPELRDLLVAMADYCGVPPIERIVARWGMPKERDSWGGGDTSLLFGSPNRTRVLLLVAASTTINQRKLQEGLGLNYASAAYAASALVREGVISKKRLGVDLVLSIARRYRFHGLLEALLDALLKGEPEFYALAKSLET